MIGRSTMSVDIENNSEVGRKEENFVKFTSKKKLEKEEIDTSKNSAEMKTVFEDPAAVDCKAQSDSELIEPRPVKSVGFLSDTNDNSRDDRQRRPREAEDVTFSEKVSPSGARNRMGKKRHHSVSHGTSGNQQKPMAFSKRRRKTIDRKPQPQFLMGGTITDPLNLNSMFDEEISKLANAVTPMSSPLPHLNKDPDPVIVAADVTDPLKLNVSESGEENANLTRTLNRSGKKKRKGGKGDNEIVSPTSELPDQGKSLLNALSLGLEPAFLQSLQLSNQKDKIVSPVVPDSVSAKFRKRKMKQEPSTKISRALLIESDDDTTKDNTMRRQYRTASPEKRKYKRQHSKEPPKVPNFRDQNKKFQYGNYNRYYGYRNPDKDDPRLPLLKREWFEGKECLDIGCNTGHVTLYIAKEYHPKKIVGIDIDGNLIGVARKNIKHCLMEKAKAQSSTECGDQKFPVSMEKSFGPISKTVMPDSKQPTFPSNVLFRCANFVLSNDALLQAQKPEYDTILCLSVTKWIHLNWGDAGIKRFFRRIFLALKPGGSFILEPQGWPSYKKKKKLTETVFKNFQEIQFMPDKFKSYLLSTEVGFSSCETIGVPLNQSKGFRRPMLMFTKLNPEKSHRHRSTSESSSRHRVARSSESSSDRHHHHGYHQHHDHSHRRHHSSGRSSKDERESMDSTRDSKSERREHTSRHADKVPEKVATERVSEKVTMACVQKDLVKLESSKEKILVTESGVELHVSKLVEGKIDTSKLVEGAIDTSKQVEKKIDSSKQVETKMDTEKTVKIDKTDKDIQGEMDKETSSRTSSASSEADIEGSKHPSSNDSHRTQVGDAASDSRNSDSQPKQEVSSQPLPSTCSAESNKSSPDMQCSRYKVSVTDSPDRTG